MKIKSLFIAGLVSTAFLAPLAPQPAHAQITKQGTGYLFRMKFTKGQVLKYSMTMTSPMSKEAQKMTTSMTVKDVKNGVATLESVVNMPQSGSTRNTKPMTQTMQIDSRGKVIGRSAGSLGAAATPVLPERPVAINGTWSGDTDMSGMKLKSTYKLLSVKTVGSRTVAEISQTVSGSMSGAGKMAGQGRITLDAKDGSMLSGRVNMNITIPAQGKDAKPTTMTISTVMTRI